MSTIHVTENNLLSSGDIIANHKEYHIECGSHVFSSLDREMLIFHKRQIKTKNFKDLGSKVTVFATYNTKPDVTQALDQEAFNKALTLFTAFDEETGEQKAFLPHYGKAKASTLHENLAMLNKAGLINKLSIDHEQYISGITKPSNTEQEIIDNQKLFTKEMSYLFGLALLWGHWQVSGDSLTTIKINVPIFGQFTHHQQTLESISEELATHGFFIDVYKKTSDTIECVISDYDVLAQLSLWYNPIANFDKISKKDLAENIKETLVEYLKDNGFSAEDIDQVSNTHLKLLTVN